MPIKLAVRETLPPNLLICEIKYSRSNASLASRKGMETSTCEDQRTFNNIP